MEETQFFKAELENADKFITQLENDCRPLVDDIIKDVCQRMINRINNDLKTIKLSDDLPANFTFFDQLSVLHQSQDYNDIYFPNGMLGDYIDDVIELELKNLSRKDKIILWYSDCRPICGTGYDLFDASEICKEQFNDLLNKRYEELLPELEDVGF